MRFACHGPRLWLVYERRRQWRTQSVCVSLSLLPYVCPLNPVHSSENLIILSHHVLAVSYGRILSSYPAAVVSSVATLSIACLIVVFTLHSIPDFSDPQLVSEWWYDNNQAAFRFVNWTTIWIFLLFAKVSQFQALIAGQRRSQTLPTLFYYFRKAINILFD